jgi:hypothetical protein
MGGLNNGKEGQEVRSLKLGGHVGFDSMPDQLVNKSVQNGFCFNILSIGETGVGKSTLADSLFNTRYQFFCHLNLPVRVDTLLKLKGGCVCLPQGCGDFNNLIMPTLG